MSDMDEQSPCETCDRAEWCDGWEAQLCCTLCIWEHGGEEPTWCDECDPMDI